MKKYLLIVILLLPCIRVAAQDKSSVTDTILSTSNSPEGITVQTVEKTVVTSTRTLLQKTLAVDSATRLRFGDAVICKYLLHQEQPSEHHFLLSLTRGPTRLSYNLYVKAGVIHYMNVYHWSAFPLISLIVYIIIMYGMNWLLFWITVFDEWGTWEEWLVNAILGIGGGTLLAVCMLEDWSWNQILVPVMVSVPVFIIARWKYKKHERANIHYGGGTLIE